jgi:hypothetical protein
MTRATDMSESGEPDVAVIAGAEWRCFNCDEMFRSERCARLHFGADESDAAACQIKGSEHGLLEALRAAEQSARDAWHAVHNECSDVHRAMYAASSRHSQALRAAEEVGYARGLADGRTHLKQQEGGSHAE